MDQNQDRRDQDRISDLEFVVTHLQRTVSDLDEVVRRLSSELEISRRDSQRLQKHLQRLEASLESDTSPADERPPHY